MKTVDFSETIAASELKGRMIRHLIESMKICEYRKSRSFLDLGPMLYTYKNSNWIFSETTVPIYTRFFYGKRLKQWIFQKLLQPVT